jgi:tetratricopeptide (TPR) repeat protein
MIIPAAHYGEGKIFKTKGIFKKSYKSTKKFVKKHKKAIIITTAVVIVAVAATAVIIGSGACAAIAGGAGAAGSAAAKGGSGNNLSNSSGSGTVDRNDVLEEQIELAKDVVNRNSCVFTDKFSNFDISNENAKIIGCSLGHELINYDGLNVNSECSKTEYEKNILSGHEKIDRAFSMPISQSYVKEDTDKINIDQNFQENIFLYHGNKAINSFEYNDAIYDFSKVIDMDPDNHEAYLNRAYAHLRSGAYEKSMEDYNLSKKHTQDVVKPSGLKNTYDFSIGFLKGVPIGAVESGKQLFQFAGNALYHPIDTSVGIYKAFDALAGFAVRNEWNQFFSALAPEVKELAVNWESFLVEERGGRSGYIVGKYGADILLPGAAAKVAGKTVNNAKELALALKNLEMGERALTLALAEAGGRIFIYDESILFSRNMENTAGRAIINMEKLITSKQLGSSKKIIDSVINETINTKGYFTSKYALTPSEALDAGIKFLGEGYKEIGKPGTGLFRSKDGLRQFRIDKTSLAHFHLEMFEKDIKEPIINNHIILME